MDSNFASAVGTGNFSKYIPYGARRIEAAADDKSIKILAFEKDGKTVLIIINDTDTVKTASIPFANAEITVAVTDEHNNLSEYKTTNSEIEISAKSVATITAAS